MKVMRSINKSIVLFLAALVIVSCGGKEERMAKYLEKGKSYLAEENYDKARVELKNALQIDPKNAQSHFLLGQVEQTKGNLRRSYGHYSAAVELDPNLHEARTKLGRFYLLFGDTKKATEMMEHVIKADPTDRNARTLRAAIKAVNGDEKGALDEAAEVFASDKTHSESGDLLSALYEQRGEIDKSIETLSHLLKARPKMTSYRKRLARLYIKKNDKVNAEKVLKEIIPIEPDNMEHRTNLAFFYNEMNQLDKAESVLREAVNADPKDVERYLLLAEFLAGKRSSEAAEKELISAIEKNKKKYELRFGLADLYRKMNRLDDVESTYKTIIELEGTEVNGLKARNQLAKFILSSRKGMDEASILVEEVLDENPRDAEALLLRGKIALTLGKPDDAIIALRSVLKDQPRSVEVLSLLAEGHLLKGEKALARESLLKAVDTNPSDLSARLKLAQFLGKIKEYDDGLEVVKKSLKQSPNHQETLLLNVDLLIAKRDYQKAESELRKYNNLFPNQAAGYYRMGQIYVTQNKLSDAITEFENALQKSNANSYKPLTAIVKTYVAQGMTEKAMAKLNDILVASPEDIFARELLGELYLTQEKYPEAEKEFTKAIRFKPKWTLPYGNLAKVHQARGDIEASIKVFQQGLEAVPNDPVLMFFLANAYEKSGDSNKAADTYDAILKLQPDNILAVNNLATILADREGEPKSLEKAKELIKLLESSTEVPIMDTVGWVNYRAGDINKAVEVMENVVKKAPAIPLFQYHLGMIYYKKGDAKLAKTHLVKAVDSADDYPGIEEARETLKKIQ